VYIARIRVTLRPSILDPQGKAVQHAIASLGEGSVSDVRIGKYIEAKINAKSEGEARRTVEEVCRRLLANPVMEDYTFEIAGAE
jgi:phosphoribosylformylglycinamidine synthase PurS subunit